MAIKKQKSWQLALLAVPFIAAGFIIFYTYWPEKKISLNKVFFTVDDGATWFADDINAIPPFDHDGKTAVRAIIYSYAGGSKTFCGYLMKYPTDVRKSILNTAAASGGNQAAYAVSTSIAFNGTSDVKAPRSTKDWVHVQSAAALPILQVKAPDGSELDLALP